MTRSEVLTLIFVLILAFGLRLSGAGFESLWLDECYQTLVEVYGQPRPDFVSREKEPFLFRFADPVETGHLLENFSKVDEVCPPLYAVLLNGWIRTFGGSDIAIRLLSCLTSLMAVAGVYVISRSILNPQTALIAAIIMAVSPFDIAYAQEARMYSLAELSAVLSFGSMICLCRRPSQSLPILLLVTYALSTWAMINSHYTALMVAVAGGLWGLLQVLRLKSFRLLVYLSIGWLGVFLLWLPWLHFFLDATAIRKKSLYVARQFSWSWPLYALFAKLPINWLSYLSGRRVALPLIPLYATSASFMLLALKKTIARDDKFNSLLALWFWALIPALGIWFVDVVQHNRVIEVSRYLIGTAPAIYMLSGAGLTYVGSRYKFGFYLFLCHVVFAMSNNVYQHIAFQKEPWRQMAQLVEANVKDATLFVCQPYDIVCLDRYLNYPRKQVGLSTVMTAEQVANSLAGHDKFYLLTALEGETICARIPASYEVKQVFKLPRGLFLRAYVLKS